MYLEKDCQVKRLQYEDMRREAQRRREWKTAALPGEAFPQQRKTILRRALVLFFST